MACHSRTQCLVCHTLAVACLVAFLATASFASAQASAGGGGTRPSDTATSEAASSDPVARLMPGLFHDLTLTDGQKKSADSILAVYQWRVAKVTGMGPRLQRLDLRHKEVDDLRTILTPAQQPTFDKNREAIRARAMAPQQ
jgi:hypothetical protein